MHLGCKIHKGQLHYTREDVDILELLLEHGGSDSVLKLAGEAKETAVHNVAQTGNVDIMSTLLGKLDRGKVQVSHRSMILYYYYTQHITVCPLGLESLTASLLQVCQENPLKMSKTPIFRGSPGTPGWPKFFFHMVII